MITEKKNICQGALVSVSVSVLESVLGLSYCVLGLFYCARKSTW